jgi:hypothetical protein
MGPEPRTSQKGLHDLMTRVHGSWVVLGNMPVESWSEEVKEFMDQLDVDEDNSEVSILI